MAIARPLSMFAALAMAAALLGFAGAAQAQTPKRVALVIGNSAYKEGGALKNPVNDARAMAENLRQLGFHVIARENATKQQMERAVGEFGDQLSAGAIALFYYAGHGMQVNGRNFLVPVDATITSEPRVRLEALDVDLVLDQMAASSAEVNLLVLDACRNNPFERRFRSRGAGLAQINAPKGTLIAYATAPGTVAADGDGANGVYTAKLLGAMRSPGLPIEEVFKRVRVDVSRETNDAQTPWEASSLTGSFYFIEPKPAQPAGPSEAEKEMMYWDSVKTSDDPGILTAYLDRYPNGTFATLARAKIKATAEKQRIAALPPPAPPPTTAAAKEEAVWDMIKASSDQAIFEMFLEKYPNGVNAEAARFKIATLTKVQAKAQPAAAPAPAAAPRPAPAPAAAASLPPIPPVALEEEADSPAAQQLSGPGMLQPEPAPAATAVASLTPGTARAASVDGIWHGTYSCGMSARAGLAAFSTMSRVFAVKQGKLTGKFEGGGFSEELLGTVELGGKVNISGTGTNTRSGGGYSMSFQGKEENGAFIAKGRQFDRECTLYYRKVQ